MIINAEEAFHAVEGSYFLHGVLIPLRVGLFLAPISPEVEEGKAAVEEVRHGSVFAVGAAAGVLRGARAAFGSLELSRGSTARRPLGSSRALAALAWLS